MVETAADGDEESCSNRTSDGEQLDLTVAESSLEVVLVLGDDALGQICVVGVDLDVARLLAGLEVVEDTHDCGGC